MTSYSGLSHQLRLQTWMSSAFPTGAYTYSHGIEAAIADERLHDADSCLQWIDSILRFGSGRNDAILMAQAFSLVAASQEVTANLRKLNDLALALQTGAERYRETTHLATSFLKAAEAWPESQQLDWAAFYNNGETAQNCKLSLPVVIGALGALHKIPLGKLLAASLQSSSSNLVWIATRLIPLGQNQSLTLIARLEPVITELAKNAVHSSVDELGSCALLADIASIQHETLHSRVCNT